MIRTTRKRWTISIVAVPALLGSLVAVSGPTPAAATPVTEFTSSWTSDEGEVFTITNHLVDIPGVTSKLIRELAAISDDQTLPSADDLSAKLLELGAERVVNAASGSSHEYMVVWAGDVNAGDYETGGTGKLYSVPGMIHEENANLQASPVTPSVGPDFLAVIDVQKGAPSYGQVVNTVTVPFAENEPHHMQYIWHKGHTIFAGGLYSDAAFALNVANIPVMTLNGVNLPHDTPCGSVPDAFWVLEDGTAYGTWMGGPDLPGPCRYTNGETRIGAGYATAPGSLVYLDSNGKTISENPADMPGMEPNLAECVVLPPLVPQTCANPHGIQAREDLNRLVTSDFAEPGVLVFDPLPAAVPTELNVVRRTIRVWDISDRANPKVVSVARLPDGPRPKANPAHGENMGVMETTVTNLPGHKGAFAESMCGAAIYYTPDITAEKIAWREVFDHTAVANRIDGPAKAGFGGGGCDGGGWIQTSLNDKHLYHVYMGRRPNTAAPLTDPGTSGALYALNIEKLLKAGKNYKCNIDTAAESTNGGSEKDCPTLEAVLPVQDSTSGGPHWGAMDNFVRGSDGTFSETQNVQRLAYANYFVARLGWDGDHQVCMVDITKDHQFVLDTTFRDEVGGTPCVDFDRKSWPHGPWGDAKPHSMVFVVPDVAIRE